MRLIFRICAWLMFCIVLSPAYAAEYLELTDFHLIDGTGAKERLVKRLIARDGVIVSIDDRGTVPTPEPDARWTKIGLNGAWVMPGLIDTHVHVARFPDTRAYAQKIMQAAVRGGVTGVRDLAGDARALAELERSMGANEFIGPELVFSALFGGPDIFREGPTTEMAPGRPPGEAAWARAITADSDPVKAIAEAKGSGVTNIKVYGDLSPGLATSIISEAKRQGMMTTAHATVFSARPSDLVNAGVGSLAHAPYLVWEAVDVVPTDYRERTKGPWERIPADHPKLLALYKEMAARGVYLDATLYVYKTMQNFSPEVKADWADEAFAWAAKATSLAREAGVPVTTGTDWFEPSSDGELPHTHEELALLVEAAGFTPMQAIIAGTRNGARAIGKGKTHGTVEVSKVADLLVLEANPLLDIRNTSQIKMTIRKGQAVSRF